MFCANQEDSSDGSAKGSQLGVRRALSIAALKLHRITPRELLDQSSGHDAERLSRGQ